MTAPGQCPDGGPDGCPDTRTSTGGRVRTTPLGGEVVQDEPPRTRADTVRTTPDNPRPDNPGGVRIEYRARVPRRLLGAALAEAFGIIARETGQPGPTADTVRTDPADMSGRRAEVSASIAAAFDLPPDLLRKDPRP